MNQQTIDTIKSAVQAVGQMLEVRGNGQEPADSYAFSAIDAMSPAKAKEEAAKYAKALEEIPSLVPTTAPDGHFFQVCKEFPRSAEAVGPRFQNLNEAEGYGQGVRDHSPKIPGLRYFSVCLYQEQEDGTVQWVREEATLGGQSA
jgi:hypothetical protein